MSTNLATLLKQAETGSASSNGPSVNSSSVARTPQPSPSTLLDRIVHAVLYEGYILYPYRPSSKKNQVQRFTFGRVYPRAYSEDQGGAESCMMQAECLLRPLDDTVTLELTAGFLQPAHRQVSQLASARTDGPGEAREFQPVPRMEVEGKLFQTWSEAVERKLVVEVGHLPFHRETPFHFGASQTSEPILDSAGALRGEISRRCELLEGALEVHAESVGENLFKITVRVKNHSPLGSGDLRNSVAVLHRSFVSTHVIFQVTAGELVSLLDPPPEFKSAAENCENVGLWPVLVGDESRGERQVMLASPIILYDYPKIAPESVGDFFDGTEIDEMLTLRVLTMTDEEKREMEVDDFSRRVLERTHGLDAERFLNLHGVMREASPAGRDAAPRGAHNETAAKASASVPAPPSDCGLPGDDSFDHEAFFNPTHPVRTVSVEGVDLKTGDRVSICPKRRADALDLMLTGKTALIEAIEQDAEGKVHLALVLEDDPGRDMGLARQSGHRFFYGVDEVRPVKSEATP